MHTGYIKKILTDEEIEKAIRESRASFAVDGLEVSEMGDELFRRYAKGEISSEEAIQIIKDDILNRSEKE